VRRIGAIAASLIVLAGVAFGTRVAIESWSDKPTPPSVDEDRREIEVTREDASLPEGCGVRETTETLLSFTDGLSEGDPAAVDGAFSKADSFFYVTFADPHGLTGEATVDRVALMTYFESRIARGDSYRVTNVKLDAGIESRDPHARGGVRVHFVATRRATDIDGTLVFRGWAQLDCPDGDIYLMELGPLHPSEDIESWCSASNRDKDAVIACSLEPGGKKRLIFPVLDFNAGEEAGLRGRLVRRGRCLYVRSRNTRELGFPMWPPGFTYDVADGVVTVFGFRHTRDGSVTPVARTGSRVSMAVGYHGGEGPGASPPLEFKDEWKPCAARAHYYAAVSYVADEGDSDSQ
jgi:hypothetical protein